MAKKTEQVEPLAHKDPGCIGNWRLVGSRCDKEGRRLQCDKCGGQVEGTPENRLAAIDENYAGIYLRRLTAEGIAQSK